MQNYLNLSYKKANYSFKHSFDVVFNKIETVFFSLLCVIFLVTSRVNPDFSKSVSFAFVSVSMPVVNIIAFPLNTTISLLTGFNELVSAKKENKDLKEELEKMKSFYIKSLNIHQENKQLRDILNFVTTKSTSFKVARVIGKTHQMFNRNFFIDAGTNRDLKEDSIVTGDKGIVGRIVEVSEDKSRVMLITDGSSRIPVITSKARVRGILAGNGSGLMEILYLPKNHDIEVGDWVFTSGDGDTLPVGILVGVVKKVDKGYAAVSMIEDINNIDIVTILSY